MKQITVNVVSESAFTVRGHGVHTTFLENCTALSRQQDVNLKINALSKSDLVHIHTVGPYGLLQLLLGRGRKIVTAHLTPDTLVGSVVGAQHMYRILKRYLTWFYNMADGVFAVSDEVLFELNNLGVTRPIHVVPNTIDTTAFRCSRGMRASAREELGIDPAAFVVLTVGQVQPRKCVSTFIECARSLSRIRFIWVGGALFGPLSASRREMMSLMRLAPRNVTFAGNLDRERVVKYYQASDVFFFPSVHETFGLVIIEAASAGLPLLLRDLSLYRKAFSGAYVHGDETTFVGSIERFASDTGFMRHWRRRSASLIARYDSNAGVERLMRAYRTVLFSHGSGHQGPKASGRLSDANSVRGLVGSGAS